MKGHIQYQADRCRWSIRWWDKQAKKKRIINRYKGEFMPCTAFITTNGVPALDEKGRLIPDKERCQGYARAAKLLLQINTRQDQADHGECKFRIEEFTQAQNSAVPEIYQTWLDEDIVGNRKPATIKGYQSYLRTWIEPWFAKHSVLLHEIDLATLSSFLKYVKAGLKKKNPTGNIGKSALNIMSALHAAFDYAYRCGKLEKMPSFPKLESYNLQKRKIEWLDPAESRAIFENIPDCHKPIFEWLKLHFRRPGEACALYKTDYDIIRKAFTIQRAVSAREIVDSVKTNWKNPVVHYIPCKANFILTAERLINENPDSPYLFVNPRGRKDGKRYSLESLKNVWYQACDNAGVSRIWPYRGLKHTACTHFLEDGGTEIELQKLTGHKNMKSLEPYTEVTLERIRKVQEDADRRAEAAERKREALEKLAKGNGVVSIVNRSKKK